MSCKLWLLRRRGERQHMSCMIWRFWLSTLNDSHMAHMYTLRDMQSVWSIMLH